MSMLERRFANQDIRQYAKEKGVFLWEIAQIVGCNDGNFSRKLRKELSDYDKQTIRQIIDCIAKSHNYEVGGGQNEYKDT